MFAQAMDEIKLDYGTLRIYKYVSASVELSYRDDNLLWQHHRAVAPLEPEKQKYWLDKASELGWKVKDLRRAIKESKPSEYSP